MWLAALVLGAQEKQGLGQMRCSIVFKQRTLDPFSGHKYPFATYWWHDLGQAFILFYALVFKRG